MIVAIWLFSTLCGTLAGVAVGARPLPMLFVSAVLAAGALYLLRRYA
jgi:hypothetical protein